LLVHCEAVEVQSLRIGVVRRVVEEEKIFGESLAIHALSLPNGQAPVSIKIPRT